MTSPNSGVFAALGQAVARSARESRLAALCTAIAAACGRAFRGSLLYGWLTGQRQAPPDRALSPGIFRRLHQGLLLCFRKLRLDRLLQGSIFLKTAFWCALPVILAPIVPTLVVLALVLAAFASLFLSFGCQEALRFRYSPLNKWVYLYALVYAVATCVSVTPKGSLFVGAISVFFLLFYAAFTTGIRRWSQLRIVLLGTVLAGVLVSLYGFWQYLHPAHYSGNWLDTDMFSSITTRVYSTLANPNVLGTYFLLVIPLCAALLLTAAGKLKKLLYLVALGIMCVCLVLTYSRGCYLGLLFAAAIFLVLLDRRFLLLGIVALLLCPFVLPDTIIERFTSIGDLSDSSTSFRVYIWLGTLAMLKDYWFCGIGPGESAFNAIYPFYGYNSVEAPHSHNQFLQIVCDAGIVGLIVFLALLISFYRLCFSALRKEQHRDAKIFQIAAISGVSGFLLEGMTDYAFYNYRVMFLFWAFLALSMLFTKADELKAADLENQTVWPETGEASDPAPIRVLNVLSDTNIGGAGRCLLNYLRYYDRSRYCVSVLLPRGSALKPAVEETGTPVVEADMQGDRSLDPRAVPVLRRMIAAAEPDIVHTHGCMSARIAARGCNARLIYTRHSAFPVPENRKHGPRLWANKLVNFLYADRIIAVSQASRENLTDTGVPDRKIDVMMNGVEPLTLPAPAGQAQWREKCHIHEGDFVVGILARLEEYKGHLLLLEAAAQLKAEGRPVKVLIAGNGSFEPQIRAKISELGLEDQVLCLGFITEVAEFLSVLDVQANCSYGTETSSLSILEGFSIQIPAVVSSYGGNPWLVDDGENGLIFENKNAAALADCLRRLMEDPALLSRMRQRAREIYEERFTGEIFARNVESVYRRVLKK